MIRKTGNVELFELCETVPKVQCSECLLYWNQGIVFCTCGRLLKESEASQHFHPWRLDAFSIQNYVIKKATSRCSARQNWSTEKAFHSPQCAEEMSQKEIRRNSRSLSTRFNISWFATQNWLDKGEVHRDGQIVLEKDSSVDPISLAKCTGDLTTLTSGNCKVEGSAWGWWRMRGGRWSDEEVKEVRENAHFIHTWRWPWDGMRQTLEHLEPCDVCKEWVWQQRENKDWEDFHNYAHIHVFMLCFVLMFLWIWFSHCHWCRTPQRPAGGFIRQLHFTTHTQHQSSFLLDVVVRLCPVMVHSVCIPNSCIFHIAKTVFWGVVFTTPVGYSRPPSAVNDLSEIKEIEFLKAIRLRFSPSFCKKRLPRSIANLCLPPLSLTFFDFLGRPPGFSPLPPGGGRTRCRSPFLVLLVGYGPELLSSSFLV